MASPPETRWGRGFFCYSGRTVGREVRYCKTADGVRIAYRIEGEGPAVLACPMFVESFAQAESGGPWLKRFGG